MHVEELPRCGLGRGGVVLLMGARPVAAKTRLAVVVSHPVQYYVPLYRELAGRDDLELKVFFTWHDASEAQRDQGFGREVKWDIPLTGGYDHELVPNISRNPGTHHFWGLRNPELVGRVMRWKPDAVHITGYPFASHLNAIRRFHVLGIPVLFRGDSHLLDQRLGLHWRLKRLLLKRIFGRVSGCLYVGKNNYDYYRALRVPESRLFPCPHSIEVDRFAEPNDELESQAQAWRDELRIPNSARVLLYAGKLEKKKQPIELMSAVLQMSPEDLVLIIIGNGELEQAVQRIAAEHPEKFRILPFQNQSRMPVVYRLGDIFSLPSAYGETWGLAVNEAIACGRRVLVSDKVGCAPDVVTSPQIGAVFESGNWNEFDQQLRRLLSNKLDSMCLRAAAQRFSNRAASDSLCDAVDKILRVQAAAI